MSLNSSIYILEENIADEIFEDMDKTEYSIRINDYSPKLQPEIKNKVDQNWHRFVQKNKEIARDNSTYYFNEYNKKSNCDFVFAEKFRYIQAFGRSAEFTKFACEAAANNLTALSSLCLILTSDNKLVFGIKENMDRKISGFSGYISKEFATRDRIDIYDYISASIKNELNVPVQNIASIVRIGQTFSPDIVDAELKLNNKVYNNVFLIKLSMTTEDVTQLFQSSFQFKEIFFVTTSAEELFKFVTVNENKMSIHCTAAIYNYLIFVQEVSMAEKLRESLECKIISEPAAKAGSDKTVKILERLKVFKWGLIGNSSIKHYSVAPAMWQALFSSLNYPVNYFVVSENEEKVIRAKIGEIIKDKSYMGCNIAMPWKKLTYEACTPFADEYINKIKTINTLVSHDGILKGYHTDGLGLICAIEQKGILQNKAVLILGAGGACQSLPAELFKRDIASLMICDIIPDRAEKLVTIYGKLYAKNGLLIESLPHAKLAEVINEVDILINATPCGMEGSRSEIALASDLLGNLKVGAIVAEMVYTPLLTPLLNLVKENGHHACEGINMLVEQAALSFYYGFGVQLAEESKNIMKEAARAALT